MGSARAWACCGALVACLFTVGCGSSGSGTTAGSTGTQASKAPTRLARGIKGENPAAEAATKQRLSAADCKALARLAERRLRTRLSHFSTPNPPLSKCRLEGRGTQVNAFLDTGFAAHQRYLNRIDETVQFNVQHPAGLPQPVPHVGEKAYENLTASWIPALGSLLAVRGNRWLTVTIAATGLTGKQLRAEAAVLARAGFKLSAGG